MTDRQKNLLKNLIVFTVLFAALLIGLWCASCQGAYADAPSHNGTNHGNGKPPDHANAGGRSDKWNNDPDDDGHGPDRGDGTVDDQDWNNGCGNDEDRTDDNEGWCGHQRTDPVPPTGGVEPIPTKPKVVVKRTCKLVLWGWTPEVFASGIDVHDPSNEGLVLAEAHNYLEIVVPWGFKGTVLWYREEAGHSSIVQGFVCAQDELVLVEPFTLDDWME